MPAAPKKSKVRLLAISGSLRAESVNTAALQALARLSPPSVDVTLFVGLADLPAFNPDLDTEAAPGPVERLRKHIEQADGLVFCTPEYAHGVPGALKNALDWLVSFPPFAGKRAVLINARPRATHAMASLRETLGVMSAHLLPDVTLPLDGNRYDADALLAMPDVRTRLQQIITAFLPGG